MAYNSEKTRTWDLTTPNNGNFFNDEFERIYANTNYLKSEIEANSQFAYVISDQDSFNAAVTRTGTGTYKLNDDITSLYMAPGAYAIIPALSFDDTSMLLATNNCRHIHCANASINFSNREGYVHVNTANSIINGLTIKGDNVTGLTTNRSFYIDADFVVLENCLAKERKGGCRGFELNSGKKAAFNNCAAFNMGGAGFYNCSDLKSCYAELNGMGGFANCTTLLSCNAVSNSGGNFSNCVNTQQVRTMIAADIGNSASFVNSHLELRAPTGAGNDVALGFHRAGIYACSLNLEDGSNNLRLRDTAGTGWAPFESGGITSHGAITALDPWGSTERRVLTVGPDASNQNGTTRLYRSDDASGYFLRHYWTGAHWFLRGYDPNNNLHAECRVGYADNAGNADTVDGLHAGSFLRSDAGQTISGASFYHSSGNQIHLDVDGSVWGQDWYWYSDPKGGAYWTYAGENWVGGTNAIYAYAHNGNALRGWSGAWAEHSIDEDYPYAVCGNTPYAQISSKFAKYEEEVSIHAAYDNYNFKVYKYQFEDNNFRGFARFIGPMVQDIETAFDLTDPSTLLMPSVDGIALGFAIENYELIKKMKQQIEEQEEKIQMLSHKIKKLTTKDKER